MKLLIAAELPQEFKDEIIFQQNRLVSDSWKGKTIEPENMHIVLKVLGEASEKKMVKVKSLLEKAQMPPQKIKMENSGSFNKNGMPTILWVKILGLHRLQSKIDDLLKYNFEKEKKFDSYITIAKIKDIINEKIFTRKLKSMKVKPLEARLTEFKLLMVDSSEGKSEYVPLKTYNLT